VVLKRNLDPIFANAYVDRLSCLGMAVRLDKLPPEAAPVTPALPPAQTARAEDSPQTVGHAKPVDTAFVLAITDRRELGFEFFGKGLEFFRIWIVNILLTVVTLGIYSAWAKVRTQRYLYGNTRLDGASFEYLAEPLQILQGRLIGSRRSLAPGGLWLRRPYR